MSMNFDDLSKIFIEVSKGTESLAEEAVNEVAEDLLKVSQDLAPQDQSFLMGSGSVDPAHKNGTDIVSSVGFNTEYAKRMHEDFYELGDISKQKPNVDGMKVGRKYLEQPTKKYGDKYSDYVATKIEGAWK
ncbi:hypothetical protein [Schinkia azotoformans]|uniref:hypothetical protein n=1 Tax=Schinkia azotoformans TaxID=1454 RepID=UPI002DBF19AE|nr:hypothetical protein [Schinkia azotoformans]MEC1786084.1 hypothetical protein [Schinkia azotoformans]MED4420120.1 hypothetical protein [Schinkia azotoformans]